MSYSCLWSAWIQNVPVQCNVPNGLGASSHTTNVKPHEFFDHTGLCIILYYTVVEVLRDCVAQGFLLCCRATQGKTDTPSWRITTGDLRQCALRAPRHPATEVPLCRTEAMTG